MSSMVWSLNSLRRIISHLGTVSDGRYLSEDAVSGMTLCLEQIHREFVVAESLHGLSESEQAALSFVLSALNSLQNVQEIVSEDAQAPLPPISRSGAVGRPSFSIPIQQLTCLIENQFNVPQIAKIIGVSVRTIHRRMAQYGLSITLQYADLADNDLDHLVHNIQEQSPMCGNRQMQGHLLSRGFRVQQLRIRESQRRVCPEGTLMRRLGCLRRRKYRVAAPRSLYHIDGNHKLIRYN